MPKSYPCSGTTLEGKPCGRTVAQPGRTCNAGHRVAQPVAVGADIASVSAATVDPMASPDVTNSELPRDQGRAASSQLLRDNGFPDHVVGKMESTWIVDEVKPQHDGWVRLIGIQNSRGLAWGAWPGDQVVHPQTGKHTDPNGFNRDGWKLTGHWPGHDGSDRHEQPFRAGRHIHRDTGTIYDPEGFSRAGRDAEGYTRDGYHHTHGFNRDGIHRDTGNRFNPDGYGPDGFDRHGRNAYGRDRDGFDTDGWSTAGTHRDTGTKYGTDGFSRRGYDADGYDRSGFNQAGFNREGLHHETGEAYGPPDKNGERWGQHGWVDDEDHSWDHMPGLGSADKGVGDMPAAVFTTGAFSHPYSSDGYDGEVEVHVIPVERTVDNVTWEIDAHYDGGGGWTGGWSGRITRPAWSHGDVMREARRMAVRGVEEAELDWDDPRY